jgi:hypothetical protein
VVLLVVISSAYKIEMQQPAIPAFHVLWTKPVTTGGKHFSMNNAEILTMVVSALMWQKHNGSIKLYTDNGGFDFIRGLKLSALWDGGIDTELLENNDYPINPEIFWAAGKLIALEPQTCPSVMLDTDLIVTQPIQHLLASTGITALHSEALHPEVYLPPSLLKKPAGFNFPDDYNWNTLPSNTAFLYIRDESFKSFYLNESKRFMFQNMEKPTELVSQMVFAEQRLLSICADRQHLPITYLLSDPFSLLNSSVIHLWGFKNLLRQNENIQTIYSKQLIEKFGEELSVYSVFTTYVEKYILCI